jgi:eukaryotic-like serine/threonine-protein kinase
METWTPERWRAVGPLFERALEVPLDARSAWLAAVRAEDPALAGDLEVLLEEHRALEREGFLETSALPPSGQSTLAGRVLGAYTLISPVGQGGMGTVWLAKRSDGRFEGAAAVKLLSAGLVGRAGEERFRREGSILARLHHPHIAQLLDAGVSPWGQPYLVLEYVEGERIDTYCERQKLSVEERLRLFLSVLDAVALAHANLIVHRDIKPSNVLVAKDGSVKLLDFGIAKLLEAGTSAGEATALTRDGGRALTPEYAAPEQVTAGAVTTATDVFSLGVLLYLLLSGRHPAEGALLAPADLLRSIVDTEPRRISEVAESETQRRQLRGDLDTIVAKTLKKRPEERYSSVTALGEDIRRYLRHEPIAARPDTLAYRAAKFVRRNRTAVVLAALVLIALAAGLVGTVTQARRATRQAALAEREARAATEQRDFALNQLIRARGFNEFTAFLLGQAVPGGKAVTMRELLGLAERLIDKRFASDQALAVDLLVAIGDVYNALEETDNARRVMRRAYDTSRRLADPSVQANAACGWARTVALSGDFAQARRLIDGALAVTTEEARFDDIVASCLADKGYIASTEGDPDVTIATAQKALDRLRRAPGSFAAIRANAMHVLALGYDGRGETANADRAYAQAMKEFERIGRENTNDGATLLNNWAITRATVDTLGAFELQGRAIAALEAGQSAEAVPAAFRANYGRLLNRLARYREARSVYQRAREDARRHENVRTVGTTSLGLARACRSLGDLDCARAALREAEPALRSSFPAGHYFLADLSHERGMLAAAYGDDQSALRLLTEALDMHEKEDEKHASHIETLLELWRLELRSGRIADADRHARRALELAEGYRGEIPHSSFVGLSQAALAEVELARGNESEARRLFGEAVSHMRPTLGDSHPAVVEAQSRLTGGSASSTAAAKRR